MRLLSLVGIGVGLAAGVAAVLVACSGVSVDTACADNAHAICTKMQACTPEFLQGGYGDEATCETRQKLNCMNALAAGSTGASASGSESCAQAYPNWACADYRNRTNIPAPCAQALGSLGSGSACEFPAQCQSGFCAIIPGTACGTCAPMPKAGDPCDQLTTCGPSLVCTLDTHTCVAYVAQGGACGMGQPCGASLACVASGGIGTPGTCQPAGTQAGTPCDGTLKTAANCDGALGLYCDGLTMQCAMLTYASSGACGYSPDAGTNVQCTSGACVGGQCVPRSADNGSCAVPDSGANNPTFGCLPPARCVGGSCQVPTASGCH